MCGIVGIMDVAGTRAIDRDLVSRMNETQHHRGPDEGGLHVEPGVGLGHRRLSIIDLSTGQQPLCERGRKRRRRLQRRDLQLSRIDSRAHRARPRVPDPERHRGHRPRLGAMGRGLRDAISRDVRVRTVGPQRETLFLARDRLGVKPLHYALAAPAASSSSDPSSSRWSAHPEFRRELDPFAIEEYFALGYVPEPRTIYAGVRKLPPGHTLTIRRGRPVPEPREYWDVRFTLDNPIGERDAEAELVERLRESVRLRMIAEVPLGAFLSGGVDSSAVVAMMAGVSAEPVNTCSIAFARSGLRRVEVRQAGRRPVPHAPLRRHRRKRRLRPDRRARADLRRAVRGQFRAADLSRVSARAQARDRRACPATAATRTSPAIDATACTRWKSACAARCRSAVRRPAFGMLGRMYPKADWAPRVFRAKSTFQALARTSVDAYFHSVSILRDDMRHRAVQQRVQGAPGRLFGGRGLPPPRPPCRNRRSVRAGPVPRSQDIPRRRHQHQGGSGQHGPFARGARAADGSRRSWNGWRPCRRRSRCAARKASTC